MKFKFKTDNPRDNLFNLLGHVRSRVFVSESLYLDIGRFSFSIVSRIRLHTNANFSGLAARIGDYCEFSECDVLLGGEHKNDHLINLNFSASPVFQKILIANGVDVRHNRKGPLAIGNGVVVGHSSVILSGVQIGDGTAIGAGSVVVSECEAFSVYAGNPARKIKARPIDQNAFDVFMGGSVSDAFARLTGKELTKKSIDVAKEDRVHIKVQFVDPVKGGAFVYQVVGATVDGRFYPLVQGSEFHRYWDQAKLPAGSEMMWIENPLALSMT